MTVPAQLHYNTSAERARAGLNRISIKENERSDGRTKYSVTQGRKREGAKNPIDNKRVDNSFHIFNQVNHLPFLFREKQHGPKESEEQLRGGAARDKRGERRSLHIREVPASKSSLDLLHV